MKRINPSLIMLAVLVLLFAAGYIFSGRDQLLGEMARQGFAALLGAGTYSTMQRKTQERP